MGTKHSKKRYLIVNYIQKPDKKFDEVVELSKKKIGAGKMAKSKVILDLLNKKVVKCVLPGVDQIEYKKLEQHYLKYYAEAIKQFLSS